MATTTHTSRINHREGMGDLLDAPGYPTHTAHVQFAHLDSIGRIHCWRDGGSVSLEAAIEDESVSDYVRAAAGKMIADWHANRPALGSGEVQAWIAHCLGYFRGCYRNPDAPDGGEWHAGKMVIDQSRDPLATPDDHAAVNLIRKFYPEYNLTRADLDRAHWGDHDRVGCQFPNV